MAEDKKLISSEDFVTKWPLYTPIDITGGFEAPARISLRCTTCRKETTWARYSEPHYESSGDAGFYWVKYVCVLCGERAMACMYRYFDYRQKPATTPDGGGRNVTVPTKIHKIGQYPPLSVDIPAALEKNLGEEAVTLYKKALVNRNQGYGLGAVTYIRRVVEDKTDELIEVVAQLAESQNVDRGTVAKVRAAATEKTTYDKKLNIAATVLPDSLVIDGVNPLAVLYGLVSKGVHELTEEQCIEVADETKSVFEFTFTQLRAETKARKDFVSKVKEWAGGTGKTKPKETKEQTAQ